MPSSPSSCLPPLPHAFLPFLMPSSPSSCLPPLPHAFLPFLMPSSPSSCPPFPKIVIRFIDFELQHLNITNALNITFTGFKYYVHQLCGNNRASGQTTLVVPCILGGRRSFKPCLVVVPTQSWPCEVFV